MEAGFRYTENFFYSVAFNTVFTFTARPSSRNAPHQDDMTTMSSILVVCALCSSSAALQVSPKYSSNLQGMRLRTRGVAMSSAPPVGEDEAAKRAESGKAAMVSLISGTVGALPFLLLDPGAFSEPSWEFQADGL